MPGCVLRIKADHAVVDRLQRALGLPPARSGVVVSEADGDQLDVQVADAINFLHRHVATLRLATAESESLTLDFGFFARPSATEVYRLPREILALAGELGIGIELSRYSATH